MNIQGQAFIKSLYSILNNFSLAPIICWEEGGLSFSILSLPEFESIILKNYFPDMSLKHFKSKLKTLEFSQKKKTSSLLYSHRFFQRQKPQLMKNFSESTKKPSRKKISLNEDFLLKITKMESLHNRMEEAAENLERKFSKMIELNKFLINELEETHTSSQLLFQ